MNKVTIDKEEYDDLCNMRDYIYDNNLVVSFEMFVDLKRNMEQVEVEINEIIIDEEE